MRSHVTLRDVAERAGVSVDTVSRALNRRNKEVWESQRRRGEAIRRIAREVGFSFNAAGRAVRTGRFGAVSIVQGFVHYRSYMPPDLFDSIYFELAKAGLRADMVKLSDEDLSSEAYMPGILRERRSDGLLILYTHGFPRATAELIERLKIPAVWINTDRGSDCVRPDDREASERATRHLIRLGHRRIAYVNFVTGAGRGHYSVRDRHEGYAVTMEGAGLSPLVLDPQDGVPHDRRLIASRELLASRERPTAVVAYAPSHVVPVIIAAAGAGMRVPEDLSALTFAQLAQSDYGLRVTTMIEPWREVGRAAVKMLQQKMRNPDRALPARRVPFGMELVAGCGPPGRPREDEHES
jgi:LacI family transcriptional regulator